MLILHNAGNNRESAEISIAAIFGVGLIGAHLVRNLYKYQYKETHSLPFSWQDPSHRKKETANILDCIRNLMKNPDHGQRRGGVYTLPAQAGINPAPTNRIDVVWSAGKGGFGMSQNDTLSEMDSFSEVVKMAIDMLRENPSCLVRFHMLSSAGGLFEGQRNVNTASPPAPGRPYGFLKLAQEKILSDCDELVQFIYRPTSVYGFAGLNHRLGLIPTLLWNGSKNKVSTIFGAPETLRDYVWAGDIGAFMAGIIASKTSCSARFLLASEKPSALFEIFNHIEKMLNKRLFCHYIKSGDNAGHNTFSMRTRPVGWNPLDMETGIRKTHNDIFFGV
jgi:UDP-glucose 4-epimerase